MQTEESPTGEGSALLSVDDLHVEFQGRSRSVRAVQGISLHLNEGETLAIVGESGSGKSTTALALSGLLPRPAGRIVQGSIWFDNARLATPADFQRVLGEDIAMIFQDPMSSLNPVMPVGKQIGEAMRRRRGVSTATARRRAIELMEQVRIPAASARVDDYPHQFSGGMRQRVMIALALALDPRVLIADEPTTALDVTVQAQIMQLLARLRDERKMGVVLITHDLGVVAQTAHRVLVMYGGKEVESGRVGDVFARPAHPYTRGLLASIPELGQRTDRLHAIPGQPPDPRSLPTGCPFHPRCERREEICTISMPERLEVGAGRRSACHFATEVLADA